MAVDPQHATLAADVEQTFTLASNYGRVRIIVAANPAVIYVNTRGVAVPAVASDQSGNHLIPPVICVVELPDETTSATTVVRVRSVGTPTISVVGV